MESFIFFSKTNTQNSSLSNSSRFSEPLFRLCNFHHEGISLFHFSSIIFVQVFIFNFFFFFLDFLQHPDPIGDGLGDDAIVEAAGPECIIPGQATPIKLLGLKVPISCFKFCIRNQIKLCELWSTDTDMWTLILV